MSTLTGKILLISLCLNILTVDAPAASTTCESGAKQLLTYESAQLQLLTTTRANLTDQLKYAEQSLIETTLLLGRFEQFFENLRNEAITHFEVSVQENMDQLTNMPKAKKRCYQLLRRHFLHLSTRLLQEQQSYRRFKRKVILLTQIRDLNSRSSYQWRSSYGFYQRHNEINTGKSFRQ